MSFKKDIKMVHKRMKRTSTSLTVRKLPNKATSRYHFSPIRLETIINLTVPVRELWGSRHAQTWLEGIQDGTTLVELNFPILRKLQHVFTF